MGSLSHRFHHTSTSCTISCKVTFCSAPPAASLSLRTETNMEATSPLPHAASRGRGQRNRLCRQPQRGPTTRAAREATQRAASIASATGGGRGHGGEAVPTSRAACERRYRHSHVRALTASARVLMPRSAFNRSPPETRPLREKSLPVLTHPRPLSPPPQGLSPTSGPGRSGRPNAAARTRPPSPSPSPPSGAAAAALRQPALPRGRRGSAHPRASGAAGTATRGDLQRGRGAANPGPRWP